MFRVEEKDGTAFVYDGDTGSLAMIIKSNNKENGVKEDQAVISESKKGQLLTNSLNKTALRNKFCPSVNLPKFTYCNDDSDDVLESEFKRRFGTHHRKDLYGAIHDQNSFLGIFDLKPTADSHALQTLHVPLVNDEDDEDPTDLSTDGQQQRSRTAVSDFDFTSTLGQSILQKRRNANVYVRDAAANVSRYDRYCLPTKRNPVDGLLRDRQGNLAYQVSYVSRTRANGHKYAFNKRQRLERLEIIRTGLNWRARQLKRLCKDAEVHVSRLSEADIRTWTTRRSEPHLGLASSFLSGENIQPLQLCIDGTIVIQIDDSDDEEVTVSPKPALASGSFLAGKSFTFVPPPAVSTSHPIYTNGLTLRALPQPNAGPAAVNPLQLKGPLAGPKSSSTPKGAYVASLRPQAGEAAPGSDSEDSEIEFLGCVPRARSSPGPDAGKVPRFLVTNLCQPTLGPQASSLTHGLQQSAATNGSGQVSYMNRRKISSPGAPKVPISPFAAKTQYHPRIIARSLAERLAKATGGGSRGTTRRPVGDRICSDFGRLEADLGRILDRFNQQCALQRTTAGMLPEVRELAVNFQCHMCGFEEKHYHSAAKRMARHMNKYHGEVDGAVRLLVDVQAPRGEPPLIVVQAVSCHAQTTDHVVTSRHTIVNL